MTQPAAVPFRDLELRLPPRERAAYEAAAAQARDDGWAERLFARDASLWSSDPTVQASIAQRLGWLDIPGTFRDRAAALEGFGEGIRDAGFTTALLCGIGGSSLAPGVLSGLFGPIADWPALRILDTTDPAAVAAAVDDLDPLETLVVVSTKSGTTVETIALFADAWARIEAALKAHHAPRWESPGDLVVAITDPESSLRAIPHHDQLREIFLNPPDVGGRFAALTNVGLVPASIIGIDLDPLLDAAALMLERCRQPQVEENPGLALGLALGTLARAGRDKLTLVIAPELAPLGPWIEQLVAESTGKRNLGIVPIDGEPLAGPDAYGPDRVFVRIELSGTAGSGASDETGSLLDRLAAAGHPVVRIELADPIDVGGEFVRWAVAVSFAGAVLGIDPFDQPSVEESKELARRALSEHESGHGPQAGRGAAAGAHGRPSGYPPLAEADGLTLFGDTPLRLSTGGGTLTGELRRHVQRLRPTGYAAIQAFIGQTPERDARLASIRALIRDRSRRATTAGYGPRYLHSTGQLHKGGAPVGWFVQLTADHPVDRPIPGRPYTFGDLIDAQADGDFEALEAHELPIVRFHLGADPDAGLAALERALGEAFSTPEAS